MKVVEKRIMETDEELKKIPAEFKGT